MNPVASPTTDESEHVDGRTLRRTRNRDAVITSLLDMIREGELRPAAADIAERAGVSHRSVFRYFDDLDDLVSTAIDVAFEQADPFSEIPDLGVGTLDQRIVNLVDARLRLFAFVDGPMKVARIRAATIPSIDTRIAEIAEFFRDQIRTHFATELATIDGPDREFRVDAVVSLTSYDVYAVHLRFLSSTPERIRASWISSLDALLST
jgi:AcrR family transcriptional regulator